MGKWLTRAENNIFLWNIIFLYAFFPDRPTLIFSDFARRTTNRLGLALHTYGQKFDTSRENTLNIFSLKH